MRKGNIGLLPVPFREHAQDVAPRFFCLLAFNVVNFILRRWTAAAWLDWVDGASGLLLGAAVGLMLLAARSNRLRHRTSEEETGPCR